MYQRAVERTNAEICRTLRPIAGHCMSSKHVHIRAIHTYYRTMHFVSQPLHKAPSEPLRSIIYSIVQTAMRNSHNIYRTASCMWHTAPNCAVKYPVLPQCSLPAEGACRIAPKRNGIPPILCFTHSTTQKTRAANAP